MRLPAPLRTYRDHKRLAVIPPYLVLGIVGVVTLGWWGIAAFAGAIIVGLIILLWGGALVLEDQNTKLDAKATELRDEIAESGEQTLQLEGELYAAQSEAERFRSQADAPMLNFPGLLHAIDMQLNLIATVEEHRSLRGQGVGDWPVTAMQRIDDEVLRVSGHADAAPAQVEGQLFALVQRASGSVILFATISAWGDHTVGFDTDFYALPDAMQEDLIHGRLDTADFVLSLAGLHAEPYSEMEDAAMKKLSRSMRETASELSSSLAGPDHAQRALGLAQ